MANFNIINLTKRDIVMVGDDFKPIAKFGKNTEFLKCTEEKKLIGMLDDIPIYSVKYTLDEQPPKLKNTFYIVSSKVLEASDFRDDFLTPVESHSLDGKVYITGLKRR